jgi:hypothetical protein
VHCHRKRRRKRRAASVKQWLGALAQRGQSRPIPNLTDRTTPMADKRTAGWRSYLLSEAGPILARHKTIEASAHRGTGHLGFVSRSAGRILATSPALDFRVT